MRFCHLYHPRIVHLCNLKEVAPSKRLNSKVLIYLFYLFVSWFHNNQIFKIFLNEELNYVETKGSMGYDILTNVIS